MTVKEPKKPNVHERHRERMRQRFREGGFSGFAQHEVLEYLLFMAIPRKNVNPIAHELLNHFGSIDRVLEASAEELQEVKGIGAAAARLIEVVVAVNRYALTVKRNPGNDPVTSVQQLAQYMESFLISRPREVVYAIYLNDQNRILKSEQLHEGTVNSSSISEKVVANRMITLGATQIVIGHNHPQGCSVPSQEDLVVTKRLASKLEMLGLRLLDHVIVGTDGYMSFRLSGQMNEIGVR